LKWVSFSFVLSWNRFLWGTLLFIIDNKGCVPYQDFFDRGVAVYKEATEPRVCGGKMKTSLSFMVSIMTWFPLQNVSDDHRYVVKSCLPSWLNIGFLTRLAQWMPLAKQELLTIQEHLFHPLFLMGYFVDGPLYCLITLWYLQTCLVIVISCKLKRYLLNPTPPATQFLFYVAHYVHVHKNCKNSWSFISI
jgi:hypothetical protein